MWNAIVKKTARRETKEAIIEMWTKATNERTNNSTMQAVEQLPFEAGKKEWKNKNKPGTSTRVLIECMKNDQFCFRHVDDDDYDDDAPTTNSMCALCMMQWIIIRNHLNWICELIMLLAQRMAFWFCRFCCCLYRTELDMFAIFWNTHTHTRAIAQTWNAGTVTAHLNFIT